MKKDILAALTFLVTGLLFYVVQTGETGEGLQSMRDGCPTAEAVMVKQAPAEAPAVLILKKGSTRDS